MISLNTYLLTAICILAPCMHTHTCTRLLSHTRTRTHANALTRYTLTHTHTHTLAHVLTYIHTVLSSRRPGSQNRATCHERDSGAALLGSPCPPLSHAFRHCICCDRTSMSRPFWSSCARTGDLNPKPQTLIPYTRFGRGKKKKRERKKGLIGANACEYISMLTVAI